MRRIGNVVAIWVLVSAPLLGVGGLRGVAEGGANTPQYRATDPIQIDGDADFTAANGVVRGAGTPGDPYVIEGLEIDASFGTGIAVYSTTAYFVIRDVVIRNGDPYYLGIHLSDLSNATIEDSVFEGASAGVKLDAAKAVTLARNRFTESGIFFGCCNGPAGYYTSHKIEASNLVDGLPVKYLAGCADETVNASQYGETIIADCRRITIAGMDVSAGNRAMQIFDSEDVRLAGNRIAGNASLAVQGWGLRNVSVDGNSFDGLRSGITLTQATNVTARQNSFSNGTGLMISGGDILVINNTFDRTEGTGLTVTGTNIDVEGNIFNASGKESLSVRGTAVGVLNNTFSAGGRNYAGNRYLGGYVSRGTPYPEVAGGISIIDSDLVTIGGNRFLDNHANGLSAFRTNQLSLTGNLFENNAGTAAQLVRTPSVDLVANSLQCSLGAGVSLVDTVGARLRSNAFAGCGVIIVSDLRDSYTTHEIGPDNTVNGLPLLYFANQTNVTVDGVPAGQVIIAYSQLFEVHNLSIPNTDTAILIAFSDLGNVTDNRITDCRYDGIKLTDSTTTTVARNTIERCRWHGIIAIASFSYTVSDNVINDSRQGISLIYGNRANVMGNRLSGRLNTTLAAYAHRDLHLDGNLLTGTGFLLETSWERAAAEIDFGTQNRVNGLPVGFHKNCEDAVIDGLAVGQVILLNCKRVRVSNLTIADTERAIFAEGVEGLTISANTLKRNYRGVSVSDSGAVNLSDNVFFENSKVSAHFQGVRGGSFKSNSVDGTTGLCVSDPGFGGNYALSVYSTDDFAIESNSLTDNAGAVYLSSPSNVSISRNEFVRGKGCGITVDGNTHHNDRPNVLNITSNRFVAAENAIALFNSSGFRVEGNTFEAGLGGAIYLEHDFGSLVQGNVVSNGTTAIRSRFGTNVSITRNTLENNEEAVILEDTDGASVYHNLFLNNTAQARDDWTPLLRTYRGRTELAGNVWDSGYPLGGNFWSDYAGEDRCRGSLQDDCAASDGLGDAPRPVGGSGHGTSPVDRYPLMNTTIPEPPPPPPKALPPATAGLSLAWLMAAFAVAGGAAALFAFSRARKKRESHAEVAAAEVAVIEEQPGEGPDKPAP